jgi:hypothetical protein
VSDHDRRYGATGTVCASPPRLLIELRADEPERAQRFWQDLVETTLAERRPAGGVSTK